MKSGRKIFARLLATADKPAAVGNLGNGNLRSLYRHLMEGDLAHTETGGLLLGLVMVEASRRWAAMGKGGIL